MEWGPGNTLERSQVNFSHVNSYKVPVVQLSRKEYNIIDFLKIDVEGSEGKVFKDMDDSGLLSRVERMSVEYHYDNSISSNRLSYIISLLEKNNLHYIMNGNNLVTFYVTEQDFRRLDDKYVLMLNCFK